MVLLAERIAYLEAVIGADITQFRKGMRDIRNETGILSEAMQGIAGVGRSMTFALTTPIIAMGGYFAEAATKFDGNMRNINSLVKLNQEEFQVLSQKVLEYGMNTRTGANDASEALYSIFSAGYGLDDTSKAMDVLQQSTMLSEAGLSDLTKTTETLTATMAMFQDGTLTTAHASDVWANIVAFGVGTLDDFQRNGGKVMASSTALNVSLDNMGASAAFLSQRYGDAGKAMTGLSMAETNLLRPNETMKAAFDALGVTTGKELVAKFGSFEEAIIGVSTVLDDVDFAMAFSKTGLEAANMITKDIEGTRKAFQEFYATIDGQTMGEWQQQIQSFGYQFDRFKSALEGVAITMGNQILPLVAPMVGMLSDGLVAFAQLNPEVHRFIVILGGVVAAIGPVLWIFGSLIGTLTPMGLLFKGIIAAGSAFASNFMGIKDTLMGAASGIAGTLQPLIDTISKFYEVMFPDSLTQQASDFTDAFGAEFTNQFTGNWGTTVDSSEFLKIDGPTNLWTIFDEQGYSDLFSWDEFRDMAKKGGWDGKALDVGDMINIDGGGLEKTTEQLYKTKSMMKLMMDGGLEDAKGTVKPSTFVERFREAIELALPSVLTELGRVLTTIKDWADYHIGTGLNMLAMLFHGSNSSGGKTPIYEAVRMALNGDLFGAIDAVIPGVGERLKTALGGLGGGIGGAFPEISVGITNLMQQAGAWLINEGVPTLSRAAGYIVGRVGVAFGEVMGSLVSSITSGGAAKQAGDGLSGLGEVVLTPAMDGFNDAMKDAGVTNFADKLLSGISGALVTAAGVWVIGVGFQQGIWAAIKFSLSGMLSLAIWAGGWALSIVGKLAAALAAKSGLTAAWGVASTAVTEGIKGVLTSAMASINAGTSWVASGAMNILKAIGGAILASPLATGVLLGTFLYFIIPESFKQGMRDAFKNVVDGIFGTGTTSYLNDAVHDAVLLGISTAMLLAGDTEGAKAMAANLSGGTNLIAPVDITLEPEFWADGFNLTEQSGQDAFMKSYFPDVLDVGEIAVDGKFAFGEIKAGIDEQYLEYFSPTAIANAMAQGITWDEYQKQIDMIAIKAYDLIGQKMVEKGEEFTLPDTLPMINLEGIDIGVSDVTINTEGATVTLSDPTMLIPDNSEKLVSYITPDGAVLDTKLTEANTVLQEGVSALGVTLANNIGTGTTVDADKIYNDFLLPLESHFLTTFGLEGNIMKAMTTFTTSLPTKFTAIGTAISDANTTLATGLAAMSLSFKTEFDKVALAIDKGLDKIADWNLAALNVEPSPTMGGGTGIDGSHAGGLSRVPFDGYIAELHKGEQVLTKEEAQDYGSIPSSAIVSKSNTGNNSGSTNQVYNFNEAMNVPKLVRELQRIGYKLEKR